LLKEAFALTYSIPGITLKDVEAMETRDREWWLNRLYEQKKREAKAMEGK